MADKSKKIIVPWDFTHIAGYALEHALKIAKNADAEIHLLHIIDEKANSSKQEKLKADATKKIDELIKKTKEVYQIEPKFILRPGNIFKTINEVADEMGALMSIMGTHGMKGMQKITGSWALKVIEGSKVPFLVVQAPPVGDKYNNITFPIDFNADKVEKVKWANFLARLYKCKVHIFYKKYTDKRLQKKLQSNLNATLNFLQSNSVEYVLKAAEEKGKFHDQIISFANSIRSDVILITTTKNLSTADYMLGAPEQQIIANKDKTPVMCVNPSKLSVTRAVF